MVYPLIRTVYVCIAYNFNVDLDLPHKVITSKYKRYNQRGTCGGRLCKPRLASGSSRTKRQTEIICYCEIETNCFLTVDTQNDNIEKWKEFMDYNIMLKTLLFFVFMIV